jgi:hypothetical protein
MEKVKPKKLSVDELTRLAFVWAEQDRATLAEAWGDSEEGKQTENQAALLRAYRLKKWGKTKLESTLEKCESRNPLACK